MMPIVFCASLPPWPMLYAAADASCKRRNQWSTFCGVARRAAHATAIVSSVPNVNPSSGDTTMNATVLAMPAVTSEPVPALAIAAPTSPPMSACDELDGNPYHHVITFQAMAPVSAPNTTCGSTTDGSIVPRPTVLATLSSNRKYAATLKNAAHRTAHCGRSTRVETTVAIEFAESWNPFMKSNAKASATSSTRTSMLMGVTILPRSRALEDDALEDVRDILAAIGHAFEHVVELLELDHAQRIGLVAEQLRHRRAHHVVGFRLEAVDLGAQRHDRRRLRAVGQQRHGLLHLLSRGKAQVGEVLRLGRHLADVVEVHRVRNVLGEVEDVVHLRDQLVDLVAVERRDERLVQQRERLAHDLVAALLDRLDRVRVLRKVAGGGHHRDQRACPFDDLARVPGEKIEEAPLLGHQASEHGTSLRSPRARQTAIVADSRRGRRRSCD